MEENFYIGQIFEEMYPADAAEWCNDNNARIEEIPPIENENEEETLPVRRFEIKTIPDTPAPTHEEIRKMRAISYQCETDPITAHIARLKDAEQTTETVAKIAELMAERDTKVTEIKSKYPY